MASLKLDDVSRTISESPPTQRPASETNAIEPGIGAAPYPALRRVVFRRDCATVTLCGRVPTYYLKQLAIAEAKRIAGITKVVDRLDVDV